MEATITTFNSLAREPNASRGRAGNRLGQIEVSGVFGLAEIRAKVQFLEHDQFGPFRDGFPNAGNTLFHVGVPVRRATLLDEPHNEFFHARTPLGICMVMQWSDPWPVRRGRQ